MHTYLTLAMMAAQFASLPGLHSHPDNVAVHDARLAPNSLRVGEGRIPACGHGSFFFFPPIPEFLSLLSMLSLL